MRPILIFERLRRAYRQSALSHIHHWVPHDPKHYVSAEHGRVVQIFRCVHCDKLIGRQPG